MFTVIPHLPENLIHPVTLRKKNEPSADTFSPLWFLGQGLHFAKPVEAGAVGVIRKERPKIQVHVLQVMTVFLQRPLKKLAERTGNPSLGLNKHTRHWLRQ